MSCRSVRYVSISAQLWKRNILSGRLPVGLRGRAAVSKSRAFGKASSTAAITKI